MKITLLDVQGKQNRCTYKDWAGGFGTSFSAGDSVFAKMIELLKRSGVHLPLTSYGYIAAIAKKSGHEVEYLKNDLPEDSDITIIQSSIVDYKTELAFASEIKRSTDSKVCFIGPFSAQMPKLYSKHADFIIKGEPESAISDILSMRVDRVRTDAHSNTRAEVVESTPIKNLDGLPFPNWDEFPVKKYSYFPTLRKSPVLPILSSRGCFYVCNYCPYKVQWNYRTRSVKNVIDEIKHLVDSYKIKGIIFRDPLFTCDIKRAEAIAKSLIENDIEVEWGCETRLDHLTVPLLETMHESGLRSIEIGVESFYDEIVGAEKRKPIAKKHQEEIVKFCDKVGIRLAAFYIIGLPNDTLETVQKTIEYAKKLNTDVASFAIGTPFPGTKFYEHMKDKIYEKNWENFTTYTPVYKHPNLSRKQLLELKELAFITYFYRPKYLLKFFTRLFK